MLFAVVFTAVGCGNGDDGKTPASTTAAPAVGDTTPAPETESPYDANGYLKDDLDKSLNFGGETFHILAWEHSLPEFDVEELSGDVVEDAVYNRNLTTEERLGVDLQFTTIKGNSSAFQDYCQTVNRSVSAGDGAYDAVACYLRSAGVMTNQHLLLDLLEVPNLNFEKPWWSDSLLELNTINDHLYFISGDIASTLLYQMMFIIYNNDLGNQLGLTNPQQMAIDGKWTQDVLFTMAENVYADLDGDSKKSEGDRFGLFSISHPNLDIFYMGADLNYVDPTEDGDLVLAPDVLSEKAMGIIDRLNALYHTANDGYFSTKISSNTVFAQGNSLFYNVTGQILSQDLRSADMNYSILPAPKYNEAQEKYRTAVAFTHTMYCLPIDIKNPAKSGAVLECMASEAYRRVTPALFETAFKYKYSNSQLDADNFEIIRDNVVFDLCRPFFDLMGGDGSSPVRIWRNQITSGQNMLVSSGKVYEKMWVKSLATISEELKKD